jgi:hypothetical protein
MKKNRIKERIWNTMKTTARFGIVGIILLFLNIASAAVPLSDGFDYPVGWPSHVGYSISGWNFLDNEGPAYGNVTHPGEDWNGNGGEDTDLGDPINAIANGHVVASADFNCGWGNITLIEHKLQNGTIVWSNYAHLETRLVSVGDYVRRGQQIGTLGKGATSDEPCFKIYPAHLHFEMRRNYLSPSNWLPMVKNYSQVVANYYNPSNFINSHRPQTSPLIGDWNNDNIDETGTYNPRTLTFALDNGATLVKSDSTNISEAGDIAFVGDWNKDGTDTVGAYRPKEAKFFLDNNNDGIIDPVNDQEFLFGDIGDYPIVGDWDKDGKDEVGVYRISDTDENKATFFLKKSDKTDEVKFNVTANDTPIIGDWNNDGTDDAGVFRRNDPDHGENAVFYLKNGDETITIVYGNNDDIPITGKPQIDKLTRVGIYRPSTQEFIFKPEPVFQSSGSLDLIFLIDTTGSMWDDIANVKASANEIVEALDSEGLDYRVAIADYRDYPLLPYGGKTDYVYNLDLPFSNDKNSIISAINGLSLGWGADEPESVYSALVHSMLDPNKDLANSADSGWRNGVTKAIIVMGDAPPHIPEPWAGGHTLADVILTSESIDPVIVYSIIIGSSQSAYNAFAEISEGTNGKVYTSPTANDIVAAIIEAIGDISTPETRGVFLSITIPLAEITPENSAIYSVNITNAGNMADTYSVSLELKNFGFQRGYPAAIQPSWAVFNSAEIALDPGISEIRPLEINVPQNWAGMEDIIYSFNVTATSTTDTNIGNTSSAELKVKADKRSMAEYSKLEIQWLTEMIKDSEIKNALLAKLTNAEAKVDQAIVSADDDKKFDSSLNTAQNVMNAFINQVEAQYDKKIMQPDAEILKEKANQVWKDLEMAKNS